MRRRSVLAGAVAAPFVLGLGLNGFGAAQTLPAITLYDARLGQGRRAARSIQARGGETRETRGEIAALLLRERLFAQRGAVLGFTGHAEFVLAADIARMADRRVLPLMQAGMTSRWLGGAEEERWRPLLGDLLEIDAQRRPSATTFAWIAA